MIQFEKTPGMKVLELGGGDRPTNLTDVNVDCRPGDKVHIVINFEETPWPLQDKEWDAIFCVFCLEHISWRKTPEFLAEVHRILKPGGRIIFVLPNTEAQLKYIQSHPDGWEDRSCFKSASITLYGDGDYNSNFHRAYFSPSVATQLFSEAGFENIITSPYGAIQTDMVLEAVKPQREDSIEDQLISVKERGELKVPEFPAYTGPNTPSLNSQERAALFDREYFNGGAYQPFQWDVPQHELIAQRVLERKPASVLELGAGRGYLGKRIQDAGVPWFGLDISRYAQMTRVVSQVTACDLCETPWCLLDYRYPEVKLDLCLSYDFLSHIPEEFLPQVIQEMTRVSHRGLHAINFSQGGDKMRCTVRPGEWWVSLFNRIAPDYHVEICSTQSLEQGDLSRELLTGDGRNKLNLGSYMTMFHQGWVNIDQHDLGGWAQRYRYNYVRHDIRQGLPYGTGVVDLLFLSHCLEHFNLLEAVSLLRECRRVIRPDGVMRIIVPDAKLLTQKYQDGTLGEYDVMDENCANSPTQAGKLWSLLHENHQMQYDEETLCLLLQEAGFIPKVKTLREGHPQILKETIEMGYDLSLIVEATPLLG